MLFYYNNNFYYRMPWYSISIALYVNKEARIGIVYNIPGDKLYTAIRGEGASCNGRPIKCSRLQGWSYHGVILPYGLYKGSRTIDMNM